MKNFVMASIIFLLAGGILFAQGTIGMPGVISYQGLVTSSDGSPLADGEYPITVTLYGDESGTMKVWQDTYMTTVHGGVFNIYLGSGKIALPAPGQMDRSLWIGARIAGGDEMRPLTRLGSSPYAMNVPDEAITTNKLADGAVTAEKMSLEYISGVSVNGKKIAIDDGVLNIQAGKDVDITYDEATRSLVIGAAAAPDGKKNSEKEKGHGLQGDAWDAWAMEGDGVDIFGNHILPDNIDDFIGTRGGNTSFTTKVNGERVMLYQPNGILTPSIIGGHQINTAGAGGDGNIIAGGGTPGFPNTIDGQFNVISGGVGHSFVNRGTVGGAIGGGHRNTIGSVTALGHYSVIGGGFENVITGNLATISGGRAHSVSAEYGTVGGGIGNIVTGRIGTISGGDGNEAHAIDAAIGGGYRNKIFSSANYATIAGGYTSTIDGPFSSIGGGWSNRIVNSLSEYSTIGGGYENVIGNNATKGIWSTIGGGYKNSILANNSTIGGGAANEISATADVGTIAGGEFNHVLSSLGSIGGGNNNWVRGASGTIAGGRSHNANADYGTIAGGFTNLINGRYGSIGGGANQSILHANSIYGTISGGENNEVGSAAAAATHGTIGGGQANRIAAHYGTVGGGLTNRILHASSTHGTISGGQNNDIGTAATIATHGTIGGGMLNRITDGYCGTIAGGGSNTINSYYGAIGGGSINRIIGDGSTIAGGHLNTINAKFSAIGGGASNQVVNFLGTIGGGQGNRVMNSGIAATIPGGELLTAQSYAQTVIGAFNIPRGNVLAGDPLNDDPIFIIGNGIDHANGGPQSNAFEVSYNGHSTVFHDTRGATPVILGSTYVDNVVYAWGSYDRVGNPLCTPFGVQNVQPMGPGQYQITMDTKDPNGNQVFLRCASVTATLLSPGGPGNGTPILADITVTDIVNNVFDIYIVDQNGNWVNEAFNFKVTGRP